MAEIEPPDVPVRSTVNHPSLKDAAAAYLREQILTGRLTPGTNILAYCVGLGWRLQGLAGSVIALAAASVPAALLLGGITAALGRIDQYRIVQALLGLGMLVAVGLVLSSAWHLWRPYLTRNAVVNAAIIGSATAVLMLFDVTPVRILLVSAAIGALLPRRLQANPEESSAARV